MRVLLCPYERSRQADPCSRISVRSFDYEGRIGSLGYSLVDIDRFYMCSGWTLPEPGLVSRDGRWWTFRIRFDPSIGKVHDPTSYPECTGERSSLVSEPYTLNAASDEGEQRLVLRIVMFRHVAHLQKGCSGPSFPGPSSRMACR